MRFRKPIYLATSLAFIACSSENSPSYPQDASADISPADSIADSTTDSTSESSTDASPQDVSEVNAPDGTSDSPADVPNADAGPAQTFKKPQKSATIAVSEDNKLVVMTNPDDGSISIFNTETETLLAKVPTGKDPSSVAITPDSQSVWVANRADATVVKVSNINTSTPSVGTPIKTGAEPTGIALSPTGQKLVIAEFAESKIRVLNTSTGGIVAVVDGNGALRNPRAIAITNNGDANDDDELFLVTEFYGEVQNEGEMKDSGRKGIVRTYSLKDHTPQGKITLDPITATERGQFAKDSNGNYLPGVQASPNQLYAIAIGPKNRFYVTSVSASPEGPPLFHANVAPVIYVGDFGATPKVEVKNAPGISGTTSLARLVETKSPTLTTKFFLDQLVDIDFIPNASVAYALSKGSDVLQRVIFDDASGTQIGSSKANQQIDLAGDDSKGRCQTPIGVALMPSANKAYINCWVSRKLGVVDLTEQAFQKAVKSTDSPAKDSIQESEQLGKRFYFTSRGRWSKDGWSSCGSCHPDGLSDNITWQFAAGPRQTTSMDGSFSHGKTGAGKQRIFNWTAIIDEMHDFEANTRGTSGGLGAITNASAPSECGDLSKEQSTGLSAAPLGAPTAEENAKGTSSTFPAGKTACATKDWDHILAFAKTIRPPKAIQFPEGDVALGRDEFANNAKGACAQCHGGNGWTISNRFWSPSSSKNAALLTTAFVSSTLPFASVASKNVFQISTQAIAAETSAFNAAPIAPPQVSCAIRNVGTFGVFGDIPKTDLLEQKPQPSGVDCKSSPLPLACRAQGAGGFNPPSLYGLSVGAPYLHHGQAKTLDDLLSSASFDKHLKSGNPNFLVGASDSEKASRLKNLKAFLLSIDADADEVPIPDGHGFVDASKTGGCTP